MAIGRSVRKYADEDIGALAFFQKKDKADAFKARMAKARARPKRTPEEKAANGVRKHLKHCVVEYVGAPRPGDARMGVTFKCGAQKVECVLEQGKNPKCNKVKDARNPKVQPA